MSRFVKLFSKVNISSIRYTNLQRPRMEKTTTLELIIKPWVQNQKIIETGQK
jgi:hypothetical protein